MLLRKKRVKSITYAEAGVNRRTRKKAKKFSLFSASDPCRTIYTPFNKLTPIKRQRNSYRIFCADGVGTKVLLAQLVGKHDTIGKDGVAMVVNDVIRCGATPEEIVDVIDVHHSEPRMLSELMKGINSAAVEAGCSVVGGETADLGKIIGGVKETTSQPSAVGKFSSENPYYINFACIGTVRKKDAITGRGIKPGDSVIGLPSSGVHSNGISLVRKVLFAAWGGWHKNPFDKPPELGGKSVVEAALAPTEVYVKPVLAVFKKFPGKVKGAVHVTGDAYQKFAALSKFSPVGFRLRNFKPQPIFLYIQEVAGEKLHRGLSDEEMFRTFNMGWGFALVVGPDYCEEITAFLRKKGLCAEVIGEATPSKGRVEIVYGRKRFSVT